MKIILILIAPFILYIIYATIRMAIDPEYRDKVEKEANRQKSRRQADKELRKYIKFIK